MNILFTTLVTFFAGMGAGLGTGLLSCGGCSAPCSSPSCTWTPIWPWASPSSDVLASAVSAYTYHKNKNLDIRNGLIMMVSVLVFTVVGSWVASLLPSATMGSFSVHDLPAEHRPARCRASAQRSGPSSPSSAASSSASSAALSAQAAA